MVATAAPTGLVIGSRLARAFEGTILHPYQDGGGVWTIGTGSTRDLNGDPVTADTPPVTAGEAEKMLQRDMRSAHEHVTKMTLGFAYAPAQIGALDDFVYNLGEAAFDGSTLWKCLQRGDRLGAVKQWLLWDHDAGKEVFGLDRRRLAECALFFNHDILSLSGE